MRHSQNPTRSRGSEPTKEKHYFVRERIAKEGILNTFDMTTDLRNKLAAQELDREKRSNYWEHRVGQACFAIMALVLILRAVGVL
jgi:hypothetical protein